MTNITMFDTPYNNQFPSGAQAYAAYVDGHIGNQPNYSYIVQAFPGAFHLSIAVFASDDADCLDIEPGAATPADVVAWYQRQVARGVSRPCLYASASEMESGVIPVIQASGFPRGNVRLWSAHYGQGEHICGPNSCGLMSIPADGTQWSDHAMGRILDQSLLDGNFFGTTPPPTVYVEYDMSKLQVLKQGDTDTAGEFWAVHRLQALAKLTGQLNGIASASSLTVDGNFGAKTNTAVRDVQSYYHLGVDGIVGAQTWGVLVSGSPS